MLQCFVLRYHIVVKKSLTYNEQTKKLASEEKYDRHIKNKKITLSTNSRGVILSPFITEVELL